MRQGLLWAGLCWLLTSAGWAAEPPNVVLINCDDLGYADLSCFGSQVHRTPRIDSLARDGMKLTSFYVTSGVCSPSRASLMTGCYPRRVGLQTDEQGRWVLFPASVRGLHPEEVTIAEVLKSAGYATACVGKWHLGDQPEFLPTRQGFDEYFGIPYSNDMGQEARPELKYPPLPLVEGEKVVEAEPDQRLLTQRYTERVQSFIRKNAKRPFFVYLPHTMPHWPQYASEKFAGKSANGIYGDSIEEIDWSTGQILDLLDELELREKTLVIFMSDNGGSLRNGASNHPLKGGKGSCDEGGMRVCCLVRWPGRVPAGEECAELITSMDWLPTCARLAGASLPNRTLDGKDVLPLLSGTRDASTPHEAFFYYWMENLECVRSGKWKLRVADRRQRESRELDQPRLYDLQADVGETTDVAADHPEVVTALLRLAEEARADLGDGSSAGAGQRPPGAAESPRPLTAAE